MVPTIDSVIDWAQEIRHERIIDNGKLLSESGHVKNDFFLGIPPEYGFDSIENVID